MKLLFTLIILLLIVYFGYSWFGNAANKALERTNTNMTISSPSFQNNDFIPKDYTCNGEDVNPPLLIQDVPKDAKSLALIMDDPDAPAGTWVHWLLWNIDPNTNTIGEDSVPQGSMQGKNSFGQNKYGGPCPPSGTHHYYFKIYALDVILNLDTSTTDKAGLEASMLGHILEQAELVGLYGDL